MTPEERAIRVWGKLPMDPTAQQFVEAVAAAIREATEAVAKVADEQFAYGMVEEGTAFSHVERQMYVYRADLAFEIRALAVPPAPTEGQP